MDQRVDYIFSPRKLIKKDLQILEAKITFDFPVAAKRKYSALDYNMKADSLYLSDHFAVYAAISFR